MKQTIKLSLTAILLAGLNLHAQDEDLGTITVYGATKSEQSIKDVTSNVEVITSAELEEKHITTVTEALNLVSGVNFTSNGGMGASTTLNLRGSSNNRTLILVDGIKYKDHSSISGTDIAHLLVGDIEKIEVIKGAQSGIWGADAAAGVINIITKEPKEGTHGSILAEGGSFNTKKYGVVLGHKSSKYDIKLSGQRVTSDGFTTKMPKGGDIDDYEDDGYENTTLNLKSNLYINDDAKIKVNVTSIDALKEYDVSSENDATMKNDVQNLSYHVAYAQKLNSHSFEIKYESTNIKRDQIGTTWGVKLTDSTSTNIELTDKFTYNGSDFLFAGLGKTSDEMDYTKADKSKSDAKNDALYLYVTNSNNFGDLVLTESVRYDDHDNFQSKTTGKLGAKYNFSNELNVFANAGTSYSVPLLVKNINPWGATNMNIDAEESVSYDVGFQYKSLRVTYFHQKVTDLIDWYDPDGWGGNPAIYKNMDGESTFKGIEIDYKKDITEDILLSLNYTRLSAKDKDNKDLARRAEQSLKLGVDYYGIEKLHLGLNGEYIGERFDDSAKTKQTGKYTVANVVANYAITRDLKVYGKIDNVTDKGYQTVDGYATSPRAYYAGLKYSF